MQNPVCLPSWTLKCSAWEQTQLSAWLTSEHHYSSIWVSRHSLYCSLWLCGWVSQIISKARWLLHWQRCKHLQVEFHWTLGGWHFGTLTLLFAFFFLLFAKNCFVHVWLKWQSQMSISKIALYCKWNVWLWAKRIRLSLDGAGPALSPHVQWLLVAAYTFNFSSSSAAVPKSLFCFVSQNSFKSCDINIRLTMIYAHNNTLHSITNRSGMRI